MALCTTPSGMTQQSEVRTYKISDVGIDKLEGASAYRRKEHFARINITNIKGVTIIGDGNVVNTDFTDLSRALADLERAVSESSELSDEQKLDAIADIGSLQSQLSKPAPNRQIIDVLWDGIQKAVTAAGFIELMRGIGTLISSL